MEEDGDVAMPEALLTALMIAVAPTAAPATTETTPAELTVAIAAFEVENFSAEARSVCTAPSPEYISSSLLGHAKTIPSQVLSSL